MTSDMGVASAGGAVLVTKDGGRSWHEAQIPRGSVIQSFQFKNELQGWGSGGTSENSPMILKTSDGGNNWTELSFEGPAGYDISKFPVLLEICRDESGKGWALGNGGLVRIEVLKDSWRILNVLGTERPC